MIVKDILCRNEDIDYGLNVIFKLDDNTFLLFDSIGFSFVEKANLLDNKWKHCSYWKNKSQINGIYEDELTCNVLELVDNFGFLISFFIDKFIC